ncbi:MAG: flippase-like domain-containing protein [Bacteroidales bacterium]|nr:flippase-like domain-containing protein [Bacteroidales bacterium]
MKERYSKIIKYAVSLSIAVMLLYFSFRGVEWKDFLDGLASCRMELVLVSMAASVVAFYLRGLRWRGLLLPFDRRLSRTTAFNAINIGYIANFVFPRIGELVRCGVISRRSSVEAAKRREGTGAVTYDKVLGTVVLERGWDMLTMLIFLVALLLFRWEKFGAFFVGKMWGPLSGRVGFSMWWILAASVAAFAAIVWAIVKYHDRNRTLSKVYSICTGIMQGFGSCLKMEHKWRFFLYTVLIWGMYWLMSIATMYAIPSLDTLNVVDALFLMIAGSLGWLVPVPGGFGSFHFIVSLALSTIYGIPFETGIIFATLSHESQAITMALCGGGSYIYETVKK